MALIERIEDAGPDRRARRLVYSESSGTRITASTVVRHLGLRAGDSYTAEEVEALIAEAEPSLAKERALRLLGYRERSYHELRKRLTDDGFSTQVVETVVDRMRSLGLVDDERFARCYVRTKAAAGYGRQRILRELERAGVESNAALEATTAELPEEGEIARARRSLHGQAAEDHKGRDKLVRKLVARGYSLEVAVGAVRAHDPLDPDM